MHVRMSIPKQADIELPLLQALRELGGRAPPRDVYIALERHFGELTEADKAERLESGGSRWQNRVQFARQNLVSQGFIDRSERGVWRLTTEGERRTQQQSAPVSPPGTGPADLAEVWDAYEEAQHERLLSRLRDLTPAQFETFAREFLRAYGFVDMEVTDAGPDG